jgi:hypothetical protein
MVFWTVLCLTLLSLIIMAWIAGTTGSISDATKLPVLKKGLYDVCSVTWQMGFGAIIGLIGGKATEVVQQYQKPPAGQE